MTVFVTANLATVATLASIMTGLAAIPANCAPDSALMANRAHGPVARHSFAPARVPEQQLERRQQCNAKQVKHWRRGEGGRSREQSGDLEFADGAAEVEQSRSALVTTAAEINTASRPGTVVAGPGPGKPCGDAATGRH